MEAESWCLRRMATKIMYLLDSYEGPHAGTEGQLLQLVEHIDRSRYEPAMTVLRSSEHTDRNILPCSVSVLDISKVARIGSIVKLVRFAAMLRREGYRLVHCFFNDVSMVAPPILWLFGIRVLVSRRDMGFWYSKWNLPLVRIAAIFVDRYVVNCRAVRLIVEEREWVSNRKISVIYNGYVDRNSNVDVTADGTLLPAKSDQPVVGIVANLRPVKRIDTLFRAFARVLEYHPDARLVVVGGDGASEQGTSMREALESLAQELGILNCILFAGRADDPSAYIARFDVAVLCSESEGLSNSLIEYMQAARPIVCTDTGGNPELVEDGITGYLVPVGDADTLADRVLRFLSDRQMAARLGRAAHNSARSSYPISRMVGEQMDCYDAVLFGKMSERASEWRKTLPVDAHCVPDASDSRPSRRWRGPQRRMRRSDQPSLGK